MSCDADVFVVGGGPAGLAAAIAARRKGFHVIVADGNRPPIDKPCGEGLLPDCRKAAASIGIDLPSDLGFEFQGIRFHAGKRSAEARFPHGSGIGVRRTTLHSFLIAAAEDAGIELRWQTPVSDFDEIRARWIIGADGASSRVRNWAGLNRCVYNSRRFSSRQHFALAPWTDSMEIYWAEGCQIYVTPVGPAEVCVALISRSPELRVLPALERSFPALFERLANVPCSSRERGAVTATTGLESVSSGNVALVGDASGSVDAITGEGICLSFKQAALLAEALAADQLARYARIHPWLAVRPAMMAKLMLLLDRGESMRRIGVGALAAVPKAFDGLLAVHVA